MIIPCTIDGKPATLEIPDAALNRGALSKTNAAVYLGVTEHTVWRLESLGKIQKTSYGTYPVASLDAHLEREMERHRKKTKG